MFTLIDEMSELIYVVDIDTYELLFVNRSGKEMFGLDDLSGVMCYQAIHGKDQPCGFCPNKMLVQDQFYTWECTNQQLQRHFLLKDKLMEWEGHHAKIEIAFDTTAGEREKQELKNALDAENLINECAQVLYGAEDQDERFDRVLERIGRFLEAERACLFELRGDWIDNTHEWCAEGVEPRIRTRQELPVSVIDRWLERFNQKKCVVIDGLKPVREPVPAEYRMLQEGGIRSLLAAPIYSASALIGYIAVDNYAVQKLPNAPALLSSIGYFVAAVLRNRQTLQLLERLSLYDALTGIGNRNRFNQDVGAFCGAGRPVGVIYMDVNGMKQINDEYGHQRGDDALVGAARILDSMFPAERVYRIGGDEFVAICEGLEEDAFLDRVRDLRVLFAGESSYTVSIGTAWKNCCTDIQELLFQADERMYFDKKRFYHGKALSGRYRHGMDDVLALTQPGALQGMIDGGKFLVYYQPKFSVATQELIGAEALVRCEATPGTLTPPGLFIPVLEESRLIGILDFYVFKTVCRQMHLWLEAGRPLQPVSVNFSRYTLSDRHFAEKLQRSWEEYRVPKALIEIEVTETVEADDSYDFLAVIRDIKARGFFVSIDDFGVRNANLSLFTTMDFDVLKVDKSLIDDLDDNIKAQAILAYISDICRRMNIKLIVEGVETPRQFQILRQLNCDGVQGFLFSKPIPRERFERQYLSIEGRSLF